MYLPRSQHLARMQLVLVSYECLWLLVFLTSVSCRHFRGVHISENVMATLSLLVEGVFQSSSPHQLSCQLLSLLLSIMQVVQCSHILVRCGLNYTLCRAHPLQSAWPLIASFPGLREGEERDWLPLFAHSLNYPLSKHVFIMGGCKQWPDGHTV